MLLFESNSEVPNLAWTPSHSCSSVCINTSTKYVTLHIEKPNTDNSEDSDIINKLAIDLL